MKNSLSVLLRVAVAVAFVALGAFILLSPSEWANLLRPWARFRLFGSLKPFVQAVAVLHILIGVGFLWLRTVPAASVAGFVLSLLLLAMLGGASWVSYVLLLVATLAVFIVSGPTELRRKLKMPF